RNARRRTPPHSRAAPPRLWRQGGAGHSGKGEARFRRGARFRRRGITMKNRQSVVILAMLLGACAHSAGVPPGLVGTWRLVEYWNRDNENQPKRYPLGEQPLGFIVYDRAGNVVVELAKNPQAPKLSREDFQRLTADELRSMLQDYVAYFGT